jgi:hypothetical protein
LTRVYLNGIYHNRIRADAIGLDDGEIVAVYGEDKVGIAGDGYQSKSEAFAIDDVDDGEWDLRPSYVSTYSIYESGVWGCKQVPVEPSQVMPCHWIDLGAHREDKDERLTILQG